MGYLKRNINGISLHDNARLTGNIVYHIPVKYEIYAYDTLACTMKFLHRRDQAFTHPGILWYLTCKPSLQPHHPLDLRLLLGITLLQDSIGGKNDILHNAR